MPGVKYSDEQIIHKLREAEVLLGQGQTVKDICRKWNITDPTYFRWRQEYGGLKLDQAKRMKTLQAAIASMESGKVKPFAGSLEMDAKAIGKHLRITFEPRDVN